MGPEPNRATPRDPVFERAIPIGVIPVNLLRAKYDVTLEQVSRQIPGGGHSSDFSGAVVREEGVGGGARHGLTTSRRFFG